MHYVKPPILDSSKDMYYESVVNGLMIPQIKDYVDADAANAEMLNADGTNGGWTVAWVLSE